MTQLEIQPAWLFTHYTEENLQKLEELMPLAEIPRGMDVVSNILEMEPLSDKQKG